MEKEMEYMTASEIYDMIYPIGSMIVTVRDKDRENEGKPNGYGWNCVADVIDCRQVWVCTREQLTPKECYLGATGFPKHDHRLTKIIRSILPRKRGGAQNGL